ncbi:uncharacterized protein LOC116602242 [Nematostella vectensis]|uniref:uncharacterized protein LOC116602242 n=1 Tax=Nematostella vectensis TaxID=45351 RepID=UPI002077350B|nr:uncharacterized protein LOC116602242 [Nematostella vectensis]
MRGERPSPFGRISEESSSVITSSCCSDCSFVSSDVSVLSLSRDTSYADIHNDADSEGTLREPRRRVVYPLSITYRLNSLLGGPCRLIPRSWLSRLLLLPMWVPMVYVWVMCACALLPICSTVQATKRAIINCCGTVERHTTLPPIVTAIWFGPCEGFVRFTRTVGRSFQALPLWFYCRLEDIASYLFGVRQQRGTCDSRVREHGLSPPPPPWQLTIPSLAIRLQLMFDSITEIQVLFGGLVLT